MAIENNVCKKERSMLFSFILNSYSSILNFRTVLLHVVLESELMHFALALEEYWKFI